MVNVVDGDTVDVEIAGRRSRVRLIGIDTPETVHPSKPVECYGREASERAKSLLLGQKVLLEEDLSQDSRDRYGRLLRYLWLTDGRLVNLDLVADGYAFEYTYRTPYRYAETFRAAEARARDEGRGLWAPDACAAQAPVSTGTPIPATVPTAATPAPLPPSPATTLPPSFNGCRADANAPRAPDTPVRIVAIDKVAEVVTLQNVSGSAVDLAGWTMCSVKGAQRHTISGVLAAGESGSYPHSGRNIWNNRERDPGLLYDPQGRLVSAWADQ